MFVFVYSSYHPHLVVVLTTLETPGAQEHFEYPKKSLLKSGHPKNTCQIFLPKKKNKIENFKPKKILRSSLSLEIKSTFLGHRVASFIVTKRGHGKIKAVVL